MQMFNYVCIPLINNTKMNKSKIFENTNHEALQNEINEWFAENRTIKLINTNFTSSFIGHGENNSMLTLHTCVIFFIQF